MPQGLHRPQVREVDVGWDEIDVPEHEVGVKVDNALHTNMRQVGQIDHEASHDVEHDPYFLHAIRFLNVDVFLGELAHRGVFEREIFKEDQDARHQTEDDRENLDGAKRPELDAFRPVQNLLLQQALLDSNLELLRAAEAIAHGREADIEGQTDHELAVGDVAATLHDVLRLDFKRSRIVNLLEVTGEVALMVVLPLDQAADLIRELRVTHVASSLVHGALVAALQCRSLRVVPQTTALVAGLMVELAADNV